MTQIVPRWSHIILTSALAQTKCVKHLTGYDQQSANFKDFVITWPCFKHLRNAGCLQLAMQMASTFFGTSADTGVNAIIT